MFRKGINSFQLKNIAIISMLIDHIATVIFVSLYMPYVIDNVINLNGLESNVVWAFYLRKPCYIIGRIAFPIFCFLIVEGFIHTKNIKKYISRLFAFSILSEIPHDLAFFNKTIEFSSQNVIITLMIGILTLCVIKWIENKYKDKPILKLICILFAILLGTVLTVLIKSEYSKVAILSISLMYLFRDNKPLQTVGGVLPLMTTTFWVIPAFVFIALYNGEHGKSMKYFFYLFYPIHLLILYFISTIT